ncbi:MAG: hypothetical protein AAB728_01490, partial [Patescibacteria group bacterium]
LLGLKGKTDELPQQLDQNYYAPYDNVRGLSGKVSDLLCRASTGDGDSRRALYTDDGTFNREYQRCVALNGINACAEEPDLLDRCLLIELERIPKPERRREKEFWKAFEHTTPRILHGIFQTLSKAMALHDSIEVPGGLNRMADFKQWGCAIAEALGYSTADFIAAYERNIGVQTQVVIDESDVAQCLVALMEREGGGLWQGTSSALLEKLVKVAAEEKINTKDPSWPTNGSVLSRRIRGVLSNLRDAGIHVSFPPRGGHGRKVLIQKVGQESSPAVAEQMSLESQQSGDSTAAMAAEVFGNPSPDCQPTEAENNGGDGNDGSSEDSPAAQSS